MALPCPSCRMSIHGPGSVPFDDLRVPRSASTFRGPPGYQPRLVRSSLPRQLSSRRSILSSDLQAAGHRRAATTRHRSPMGTRPVLVPKSPLIARKWREYEPACQAGRERRIPRSYAVFGAFLARLKTGSTSWGSLVQAQYRPLIESPASAGLSFSRKATLLGA